MPSIASSSAYWGILEAIFSYAPCESTCKTCDGDLDSNCLSCYSDKFL
jgi:hypothetical protein